MDMGEAVKRSVAEITKELMSSLDYRTLNSQLPRNDISKLVYEILEAGHISKELQIKIGEILGKRWFKRRYIFE